jgi:hypothetical protein
MRTRRLFSRKALCLVVAAASAAFLPSARADQFTTAVRLQQAEWNLSLANQSLAAVQARQISADNTYRALSARVAADQQSLDAANRIAAQRAADLANATQALQQRQDAQAQIRARYDRAVVAANQAFADALARRRLAPDFQSADHTARQARALVEQTERDLANGSSDPLAYSALSQRLNAEKQASEAAESELRRVGEIVNRDAGADVAFLDADRNTRRESDALQAVTSDVNRVQFDVSQFKASLRQAQSDAVAAAGCLASSQNNAEQARNELYAANRALEAAQANLQNASSVAATIRISYQAECAPPAVVVAVPARPREVVIVNQRHDEQDFSQHRDPRPAPPAISSSERRAVELRDDRQEQRETRFEQTRQDNKQRAESDHDRDRADEQKANRAATADPRSQADQRSRSQPAASASIARDQQATPSQDRGARYKK